MAFTISNCKFTFLCKKTWESLDETDNPDVRYCNGCKQSVYFCHDENQLISAIQLKRCVAILVKDVAPQPRRLMGHIDNFDENIGW